MVRNSVVIPDDEHNNLLVSNVHPDNWLNPEPEKKYDLIVLGAGTAGLVTAAGASGLGAKVALIEKDLLGGDCLNVGCVPSKAILRSSRTYAEVRDAHTFGIEVPGDVKVDFSSVMQRMRRLRASISEHDAAKRFHDMGIDVFLGEGHFISKNEMEVAGESFAFKRGVIATGARAVVLPIKGLADVGYLTNETVFSLTKRPDRLAVIGGGPLGCELAQAFQRLGSQVTVIEILPQLLGREDEDAAHIIAEILKKDGATLVLNASIQEIRASEGGKQISVMSEETQKIVEADEILLGAGRAPNVENLNLEAAGVEYDSKIGVHVNDRLQTTNPKIYAAGDVCMLHKFTHTADAAARIVIQNALFMGRKKLSALTIPWCTYTDPEVAHVGLYERDARARGIAVSTITVPLSEVDRAILDGEQDGFIKIHTKKGTDKILGATIVARHAGEMISEISLAIVAKVGLRKLSTVIHPYPTQAEIIKKAGDVYNRSRLTPFWKKMFSFWIKHFLK